MGKMRRRRTFLHRAESFSACVPVGIGKGRGTCRRTGKSFLACVAAVLVLCLACGGLVFAGGPATDAGEPMTLESVGEPLPDGADSALLENPAGRACVIDQAGLLDAEDVALLNEECERLYEAYGVLVAIVTVDDFGGGDILDWQIRVFREDPFGMRAQDGVMLAISMANRDWGIQTFGSAQRAFNTYGRDRIGEIVLESLSDGEYYDALDDFVGLCGRFLKEAEKGKPYSSEHPYRKSVPVWIIVAVSFVASFAVSFGIVSVWKKGMNTQVQRIGADEYLKPGSFHLTRSSDIFLYHTVSRSPKPKADSSSSSGGSSGMSSTSSGTSGKF